MNFNKTLAVCAFGCLVNALFSIFIYTKRVENKLATYG